jgi:hypothetical protein
LYKQEARGHCTSRRLKVTVRQGAKGHYIDKCLEATLQAGARILSTGQGSGTQGVSRQSGTQGVSRPLTGGFPGFEDTMHAGDFKIHKARRGFRCHTLQPGGSEPMCTRGGGGGKATVQASLIKKENKDFLIYKEIQNGAVAKSYM